MVVISKLYPEVIKTCRGLIVEDEVLKLLSKKFSEAVSKGLSANEAESSNVKCNLTYVTDFPDGREKGSFIGLDFSGRIFRLVYVGLRGDRTYVTLSRLYDFPYLKLKEGIGRVADYVARCVHNFMETYSINEKKIILGVTTSFPIQQECLQEGKVLQWGKDFENKDKENRDFFNLLRVSLRKLRNTRGIYLISMVNNSTACLLSGMYKDPGIRMGLYLGEDTNMTYLEKFENITTHIGDGLRTRTALGVEMKNFGDDGSLDFIRTEFDFQIDADSPNPGVAVLDKMVAGAQLGEIARLCLYKLASFKVILNGYISPALSMKDSLKTADLAMMETDPEAKYGRCRIVMQGLGYERVSKEDCMQIRFVARCVAKRSANLVAACLVAMIHRLDTHYLHIMSDGYLLREFPNYEYYLYRKISQLKRPGFKFLLTKGDKDEAAIGAGIVALIYKDNIIKAEDKRRILPPVNVDKYNLPRLPASYIDCNCEQVGEKTSNSRKKVNSVRVEPESFGLAVPFTMAPFSGECLTTV